MRTRIRKLRIRLVPAGRVGTALLIAFCVACVGGGAFGWWQTHELRSIPAAENQALVDTKVTDTVASEVSRALTQVLTYDYRKPQRTHRAADAFLTGAARKEYDTLFASLQERAPDQKLTLSASVQSVGVKELTDNTAKLLVFLDQSSKRADDNEATVSAAQLAITAKLVQGNWKITQLKPL